MKYYDVILRPLVTEKTNIQKELHNQVSFEVGRQANRIEIKRAVEQAFKVRVASVRTMQMSGKSTQRGRIQGRRRDWKKAIVRLMPGERIEFFEGA
jgi:large subunit ribosomal protein L23